MKAKISVTVERSLLDFLDSLPGESRSRKIEQAISRMKRGLEEKQLRNLLQACSEDSEEGAEREIWERTVAEAMWEE